MSLCLLIVKPGLRVVEHCPWPAALKSANMDYKYGEGTHVISDRESTAPGRNSSYSGVEFSCSGPGVRSSQAFSGIGFP